MENCSLKIKRTEKPMQAFDYRRIENELQHQIKQSTMAAIQGDSLNRKGWSTGHLGGVFFLPFHFYQMSIATPGDH